MKRYLILLLFTCFTSISFAQIHEIGLFVGGTNYVGDIGSTNYINPNQFGGGFIYKYNLNPRFALRGTLFLLPIQADDATSGNDFRENRNPAPLSFSNTLYEIAAGLEINFFDYDISQHDSSFTPYIVVQAAAFNYKTVSAFNSNNEAIYDNKTSYAIPVGIGIKGRLSDHMAYAIESSIRISFSDELDYTTPDIDALNLGGYGNDHYFFTGVSLVYTFGRPACYAPRE